MSDIVIGALIGIGGVIVGGCISYVTTRLQLKQQEREARRERLIRAKEGYLIPLRESISKWMKNSNVVVARLVDMQAQKRGIEPLELQQELNELDPLLDKGQDLRTEFDILLWQVSDSKLYDLIQAVKKETREADAKTIPILKVLQNPKSVHIDEIEAKFAEYNSIIEGLGRKLIPINKRIEELLSGDEAT